MKYLRFISAFETTLETAECDNRRKLLFLIQHYTGKVKSLIFNHGYGTLKQSKILYENYNKKNVIARSYIKGFSHQKA